MTSPKRLQNVFVVAERPAELHAFYETALGLQVKFRDQDRWIQYGVGGSNVALACAEEAAPATSGVVMVFEVDDFDAIASRVTAGGGQVLATRDMGSHGATMAVRDPEGNVIQLFKRQQEASA